MDWYFVEVTLISSGLPFIVLFCSFLVGKGFFAFNLVIVMVQMRDWLPHQLV